MASNVARCEPPEEYRGERWHMIRHPDRAAVHAEWLSWGWRFTDHPISMTVLEATRTGYRYLAPALPPEPKGETDGR